jgi:hypothetical protein
MNEVVTVQQPSLAIVPVAEIKQRVRAIKELISGVMVENVDFGMIPFTNEKKVLFKSGAEKICAMFRIASRYSTDDLSSANEIRYRITCQGIAPTGEILGEGMGEASTAEEKYRWRKAVCDEEFEEAPETERREVYKKGKGGGHYKVKQIKTNAADSANTILKMACKRAHVAMVLSITGCSDDFTQDVVDDDAPQAPADDDGPPPDRTPQRKAPPAKAAAAPAAKPGAFAGERRWIEAKVAETGADLATVLADAGIASLDELTRESFNLIRSALSQ